MEFEKIPPLAKLLDQTKNHIMSLASSIYLEDKRLDIAVKVDQLDKI